MEIKINSYSNNPMFMASGCKTLADRMIPILQNAVKNGETITSEQLAQKVGATKDMVRNILYHEKTPAVRSLFDQVKSPKGVKKIVTEEEIAAYSAAMTTAALAGISLKPQDKEIHVQSDYATYLAQKVEDMKLTDETKKNIMGHLTKSPLFVDFLINNKDKNNNRRRLTAENVDKMYAAYTNNTDLTEQLGNTYDDNGNFRYTTEQIWRLTDLHEKCPDLYETALEDPDFVYDVYNMKDENDKPRFGIADTKRLAEQHKNFPKYTSYLLAEKDSSGRPRFNAEQTLFILNELEGDYPEFAIDLVRFQWKICDPWSGCHAVKLSGDNIMDIINMDKKYGVQNFVYNLMDVVGKYNITGEKFVRYTDLSTKSNIEFVKGLQNGRQLPDNKYSLLEVAERKLTKEEFEELKNMKSEQKPLVYTIGTKQQEPLFDKYELTQLAKYVEK